VASLLCEWSWAIRLSAASVVAPYYSIPLQGAWKCFFRQKNFEDGNCPIPGLLQPRPYLEFLLLSGALINFLCTINRKISCLWAPSALGLNASSTHRVSSLRRDTKSKNSTRIHNLKTGWTRFLELQIYRMTQKTYHKISWDYPFNTVTNFQAHILIHGNFWN
jgi:hypothetical protein